MSKRRIEIIGAGIGGAAAALALARDGHHVVLSERAAEIGEVGAGLQLGPNAVRILQRWGVAPEVSLPSRLEIWREGGPIVAKMPLNPEMEARFGAPYWALHRADLLRALVEAALADGAELRCGQDMTEPPEADLVIGADGIRSRSRTHVLGRETRPRYTRQAAYRWLARGQAGRPGEGAVRLILGKGQHMVAYPLRGGAVMNVVGVVARPDWQEEGWHRAAEPGEVAAAFPDAGDLLDGASSAIQWGLFDHQPLESWHRGHVVLLGDACHPMLPFLAQGAAMAIEDAAVLAECLKGARLPAALARYEALRRTRTARVQKAAARNAWLYHMHPPLRALLHTGMALRAALPGGLAGQFAWLYGADTQEAARSLNR